MSDDKKRRIQSATDRDLASPHLGRASSQGEVEANADESDSDGTPRLVTKSDITPPPIEVASDPALLAVWRHVDSRYTAEVAKLSGVEAAYGGSANVRADVDRLKKTVATHDLMYKISKWIAVVVVTAAVGGLWTGIKALRDNGVDRGDLNATLRYMQRDIADQKMMIERLVDKFDEHQQYHQQHLGGGRTRLPSPVTPQGDPP